MFADSRLWRCRPSELLNVDDELLAYQVDSAVATFGRYVEEQLSKVEHKDPKVANQMKDKRLRQILAGKKVQQYADPAMLLSKDNSG